MRNKGTRPVRVLTADGGIELKRPYFWAKGQGGVCPADEPVGIEWGRTSPGAREILCRLGMVQDFGQAAEDARRIGNVPACKEKLRQVVEGEAAAITQDRNRGVLKAAWTSAEAKVKTEGGTLTRVYAGVDGVMAPMVTAAEKEKRRKNQAIRRQQRSAAAVGNARELPPAALIPLSEAGTPNLARVLGSILRRPRQIATLIGLARETRMALSALAGPAHALRGLAAAFQPCDRLLDVAGEDVFSRPLPV